MNLLAFALCRPRYLIVARLSAVAARTFFRARLAPAGAHLPEPPDDHHLSIRRAEVL
ncbi:hypothetical protein [Streptomyces sp. NPDC005423]|uniref:hypothetical protein n=1 Tax=Streptomyces sp. NPDC005423 TaxID=3155343 RepID=UPI0033AE4CBF